MYGTRKAQKVDPGDKGTTGALQDALHIPLGKKIGEKRVDAVKKG